MENFGTTSNFLGTDLLQSSVIRNQKLKSFPQDAYSKSSTQESKYTRSPQNTIKYIINSTLPKETKQEALLMTT